VIHQIVLRRDLSKHLLDSVTRFINGHKITFNKEDSNESTAHRPQVGHMIDRQVNNRPTDEK
jgi:hypothetical protein